MSFTCGDHVKIKRKLDEVEGTIINLDIENCQAMVRIGTHSAVIGVFNYEELTLIPRERIPIMEVFKSVYNTLHVVVQNCSEHVNVFLSLFDVWKSHGNYKYDGLESWERAKIWFECPMGFLDFIKTPIGEEALYRLGIEKIEVEND